MTDTLAKALSLINSKSTDTNIIGYYPLFFVNPILDNSEDTEEKV